MHEPEKATAIMSQLGNYSDSFTEQDIKKRKSTYALRCGHISEIAANFANKKDPLSLFNSVKK